MKNTISNKVILKILKNSYRKKSFYKNNEEKIKENKLISSITSQEEFGSKEIIKTINRENRPNRGNRKLNTDIGLESLRILDDILGSIDVNYWITDGTLLGLYRDGGLIEYDHDTDIGILMKDFSPSHIDYMQKFFKISCKYGHPNDGFQIKLLRKKTKTDIFFFYEKEDYLCHSAYKFIKNMDLFEKIDYRYKKFKTKKTEFSNGCRFNAPTEIEDYILQKYGPNWKKRISNWDWGYDPLNHVKTMKYCSKNEMILNYENWRKQ